MPGPRSTVPERCRAGPDESTRPTPGSPAEDVEVSEEAEFEADPYPTQPLPGLPLLLDDDPPDTTDHRRRRPTDADPADLPPPGPGPARPPAHRRRPTPVRHPGRCWSRWSPPHRAAHPKADLQILQRAYDVAEKHHRGQLRKSGDPYITHPLAVATILAELGMDTTTLVAALLHDTVEDTGYTLEDLKATSAPRSPTSSTA